MAAPLARGTATIATASKEKRMEMVVVGFDGGDEARDALRLGRVLARARDAELVVAAAFDPVLAGPGVDVQSLERSYFDDVFARAAEELGEAAFSRRELREVSAPHGLDQLAHDEGADLVVIGSTHRGKVGRVLFGSVGERLLYGAPCPVAVAPRGYAGEDHAVATVGVAHDGSDESRRALAEATELAAAFDAELRLITVIFEWLYVPESSPSRSLDEFMEVVRGEHREIQKQGLEDVGDSIEVDTFIGEGDPAEVLLEQCADLDLLVMGSRGYGPLRRTLLGGVSAQVMRAAPCPVVVVPRGSAQ
jgi:nucleotide-binding universal stress UspA family protein